MRIRELRAEARNALSGNWMKLTCCTFFSMIILLVFFYLALAASSFLMTLHWAIGVVAVIISVVVGLYLSVYLSYGIIVANMKVARGEESHFFKDAFEKGNRKLAVSAFGGLAGKVLPWFLLALLGGIVPVVGPIILIVGIILFSIEMYNYMLINYLKYDYPDKPTKELLGKSKMMMRGNKAKAIVIPISLIGWALLIGVISAGISFIFNLIWPPEVSLFSSISTVPIWATLLLNGLIYFLSSILTVYSNMTYYQLYMEQKPLELYNDDYLKPETNAKKYIWIVVAIIAIYFLIVFGSAAIIYWNTASLINSI